MASLKSKQDGGVGDDYSCTVGSTGFSVYKIEFLRKFGKCGDCERSSQKSVRLPTNSLFAGHPPPAHYFASSQARAPVAHHTHPTER